MLPWNCQNPHFQNEAKCTTFPLKTSFICMRMRTISISKAECSTGLTEYPNVQAFITLVFSFDS